MRDGSEGCDENQSRRKIRVPPEFEYAGEKSDHKLQISVSAFSTQEPVCANIILMSALGTWRFHLFRNGHVKNILNAQQTIQWIYK